MDPDDAPHTHIIAHVRSPFPSSQSSSLPPPADFELLAHAPSVLGFHAVAAACGLLGYSVAPSQTASPRTA